jgi:hypothetical protein
VTYNANRREWKSLKMPAPGIARLSLGADYLHFSIPFVAFIRKTWEAVPAVIACGASA